MSDSRITTSSHQSYFQDMQTPLQRFPFQENKESSAAFVIPPAFTKCYTDEARGVFSSQYLHFKMYSISQLAQGQKICVLRGDARPLDTLLTTGLTPKKPQGSLSIIVHRRSSDNSGAISYTHSFQVAAFSGANAARKSHYGDDRTTGNSEFTIVGVELNGAIDHVAGPGAGPGYLVAHEVEATAVGPLSPHRIKAYTQCRVEESELSEKSKPVYVRGSMFTRPNPDEKRKPVSIVCGSIFTRTNLSEKAKAAWVQRLSGEEVPPCTPIDTTPKIR